jgi:hypothetical protein
MSKNIFRFFLVILFLLIRFTLLGVTITRNEITQYALTRRHCGSWQPSKNYVKFDEGVIFTSNFNTKGTYNIEAYVYGGDDSESGFLGRINRGTCPGGRNMSNPERSTTWLYKNGYWPSASLAGIDCSAFVSECWKVSRTNTEGLANLSLVLSSKDDLKPGDILDIPREHVILVLTQAQNSKVSTMESKSPGITFTSGRPFSNVSRYTPYSIFPQFSDESPEDGELVDLPEGDSTIDISLTIKASGDIDLSGVRMFIRKDGEPEENIGDISLDDKGDDTWELKKEDFDVSEGGNFTVKVIARNDIADNGYKDEYEWEFTVDPAPPIVKSTDPSKDSRDVPVDKSPITINFSKPMDVIATADAAQTPFACSKVWAGDQELQLRPEGDLDYCKEYTITVSDAAMDTAGVRLDGNNDGDAGDNYEFTFTTEPPEALLYINPFVAHVEEGRSLKASLITNGSELKKEIDCDIDFNVYNPGRWSVRRPGELSFSLSPGEIHEDGFTINNSGARFPLMIFSKIPFKCDEISCMGFYWSAEGHQHDHADENQSPGKMDYPTPWLVRSQRAPAGAQKLRGESPSEGLPEIGILLSGWADGYGHILGRYGIETLPVKPDLEIINRTPLTAFRLRLTA